MRRDGYFWFTVVEGGHRLKWHSVKMNGFNSRCGVIAPRNRRGLDEPTERGLVCEACLAAMPRTSQADSDQDRGAS